LLIKHPFNDKLITKDECKAHYQRLRHKADNEKKQANDFCETLKDSNKSKFDFCLKRNQMESNSSCKGSMLSQTNSAMSERTNLSAAKNRKVSFNSLKDFPKVLNSIRLTNFLNQKSDLEESRSISNSNNNFTSPKVVSPFLIKPNQYPKNNSCSRINEDCISMSSSYDSSMSSESATILSDNQKIRQENK
jgi:hypothetical protein